MRRGTVSGRNANLIFTRPAAEEEEGVNCVLASHPSNRPEGSSSRTDQSELARGESDRDREIRRTRMN